VVIGKEPLWEHVPLGKTQDGVITTQYSMEALEALGLLKMDFLGLRTLTVIQKATRLVEESTGKPLDIQKVPLDDENTYKMLSRGESLGVFQLESSWVRDFLKEMKPREFKDIVAAVALCRPGPMEQIPEYIRARFGQPHYLHPVLEPVLRETYGVMVYQEQILQIAHRVAGLTLGEADILRRAVGKKDLGLLVQMQDKFLGCPGNLGSYPQACKLRIQQKPCSALRPDSLLDRLPESPIPGRVYGRAAFLGQGDAGQSRYISGRSQAARYRDQGSQHQPQFGGVFRRSYPRRPQKS